MRIDQTHEQKCYRWQAEALLFSPIKHPPTREITSSRTRLRGNVHKRFIRRYFHIRAVVKRFFPALGNSPLFSWCVRVVSRLSCLVCRRLSAHLGSVSPNGTRCKFPRKLGDRSLLPASIDRVTIFESLLRGVFHEDRFRTWTLLIHWRKS